MSDVDTTIHFRPVKSLHRIASALIHTPGIVDANLELIATPDAILMGYDGSKPEPVTTPVQVEFLRLQLLLQGLLVTTEDVEAALIVMRYWTQLSQKTDDEFEQSLIDDFADNPGQYIEHSEVIVEAAP